MDWEKIINEQVAHVIILGIFSFMTFLLRNAFMAPIKALTDKINMVDAKINKHIDACDEIPKEVLMNKLENIDEKVDFIQNKVFQDGRRDN